jgi:hypothetical protein
MRIPRQNRVDLAREVAGHRYAEGGTRHAVKLNLLAMYQTIVGGLLIANEPRFLGTALGGVPQHAVRTEFDWLNEQCERICLSDTLQAALIDALYLQGIVRVAYTTPADDLMSAWGVGSAQPAVWCVDPDDWVFDVNAKAQSAFEFEGHCYDCPVDAAVKLFGRKVKGMADDDDRDFNPDGDERIGRIMRGGQQAEQLSRTIRLIELYLPRHKKVVTLPLRDMITGGEPKPLYEQKWIGPWWGPYIHLRLGTIPGQAMGIGPMQYLYEKHMDFNNVDRKLNNMVRRMKEVTAYRRKDDKDAQNLANANDGDFAAIENPETIKSVVSGGKALPALTVILQLYKEMFDFVSNLSLIGGRGPQAKTATQEKLLNANAGAGMAVMTRRVEAFVAKVGRSLLELSHMHPTLKMSSDYRVPGTGISATRDLPPAGHPQGRNWPMSKMKFQLDPYSINHRGPEERLAFIDASVEKLIPIMPMLEQKGTSFDGPKWLEFRAELGNEPRLKEIFVSREPTGGDGATETPHNRTLPMQTERNYTRTNIPQDNESAPQQLMAKMAAVDLGGDSE